MSQELAGTPQIASDDVSVRDTRDTSESPVARPDAPSDVPVESVSSVVSLGRNDGAIVVRQLDHGKIEIEIYLPKPIDRDAPPPESAKMLMGIVAALETMKS